MTRSGGTDTALDAEFEVVQITEFVAEILRIRKRVAIDERFEEKIGQGQVTIILGHKNFRTPALKINGLKAFNDNFLSLPELK